MRKMGCAASADPPPQAKVETSGKEVKSVESSPLEKEEKEKEKEKGKQESPVVQDTLQLQFVKQWNHSRPDVNVVEHFWVKIGTSGEEDRKVFATLEDAVSKSTAGTLIVLGAGEHRVESSIDIEHDLTIVGEETYGKKPVVSGFDLLVLQEGSAKLSVFGIEFVVPSADDGKLFSTDTCICLCKEISVSFCTPLGFGKVPRVASITKAYIPQEWDPPV